MHERGLNVQEFESHGARVFYSHSGAAATPDMPLVIWAHGWGQNHAAFLPLIQSLAPYAEHIALDLPGFGKSPPPMQAWGTQEYADCIAAWLAQYKTRKIIWVGHSFGCRVGLRLAATYPHLLTQMCLIAGAGLKRKRPLHKKIYFYCRIKLFKLLKNFVPAGAFKDKLMSKFGSADYKSSGSMRGVFIRTVNEDQSDTATKITCPVTLIYGENDTETPPEFGQRFARLIPQNELFILSGLDHYTVLSSGRHQVIKIIANILTNLNNAKDKAS